MKTANVSFMQVMEGVYLIEEYLHHGGTGFDNEKLEALLHALLQCAFHSGRIVIEPSEDK